MAYKDFLRRASCASAPDRPPISATTPYAPHENGAFFNRLLCVIVLIPESGMGGQCVVASRKLAHFSFSVFWLVVPFVASGSTALSQMAAPPDLAALPQGSIVDWGSEVVGVEPSQGFVAVAAGWYYSLGLKPDGSIVACGSSTYGQTDAPGHNRFGCRWGGRSQYALGKGKKKLP